MNRYFFLLIYLFIFLCFRQQDGEQEEGLPTNGQPSHVVAVTRYVLLFYAHHRPSAVLMARDDDFLRLAESANWVVERIVTDTEAGVRPVFLTLSNISKKYNSLHSRMMLATQRREAQCTAIVSNEHIRRSLSILSS